MTTHSSYLAQSLARLCLASVLLSAIIGCASIPSADIIAAGAIPDPKLELATGDQLQIEIFGAPDLSTLQNIRRDGNITLKLVGDVKAAGLTPEALQAKLGELYKSQLQIQSVSVIVVSASPIFVTGSVITPGRVEMERPLTALQAIMQAGGFDPFANAAKVVVIRHEGTRRMGYVLNFKQALAGASGAEFYLRPYDIVYVPARRF